MKRESLWNPDIENKKNVQVAKNPLTGISILYLSQA